MSETERRVCIVGGGLLGMTLALRLRAEGHSVTIIEGARAAGGLAVPQTIGGYTWDRYYHVILLSDSNLRGLLEELDLADQLHWRETRTGFYTDGKLHSLSSSLEFLMFEPLSLFDKIRLAFTITYASRITNWRRLEQIPVTTWLRRLSGRKTFERIWLPLLKSKLGENYRITSAAFIWATIARLYGARRSGLKKEMFGYVSGGYETILSRLSSRLAEAGIEMRCGQPVKEVQDVGEGVIVELADGERLSFDRAVMTVSCNRVARLCPQLTDAERTRLDGVVYLGIVCASVLMREPLGGFYVTNITDGIAPFTGVIEMTTLVDRATFGGNTLVYLPRYLTQDDPYWQRQDAEIEEEFLDGLERMYPAFQRSSVLAFRVSRVREVIAVSTLNYSEAVLPPVRTSLPNVCVVNSAQIASGTLNVNETVGLANEKSAELNAWLGVDSPAFVNANP
jgi:protoporphyrinogen oxidase